MAKITDKLVRELTPPISGNRIVYDDEIKGFGIRVTTAGAKSFIVNYYISGRERRFTIGPYGTDLWTVAAARKRAGELRRRIALGEDPLAARVEARQAPTVSDLVARFVEEHLPKTRRATQVEYLSIINNDILPQLASRKVTSLTFADIDAVHRRVTRRGATYRANRTIAVFSKMLSLAVRWGWRPDNPARGIERNPEPPRHRYLAGAELARLTVALAAHPDQQAANIVRLLLLTGARRGEVQAATWDQFDLAGGVWTKPPHATKQGREHRVPLSAPARQLLAELRDNAAPDAIFVFPAKNGDGHRRALQRAWQHICQAAGISGARPHDLRHSFASLLVSGGASLPLIGSLLGHSEPSTTARYSHLFDDPLRAATERVGAIVTGQPPAEVVPLRKGG